MLSSTILESAIESSSKGPRANVGGSVDNEGLANQIDQHGKDTSAGQQKSNLADMLAASQTQQLKNALDHIAAVRPAQTKAAVQGRRPANADRVIGAGEDTEPTAAEEIGPLPEQTDERAGATDINAQTVLTLGTVLSENRKNLSPGELVIPKAATESNSNPPGQARGLTISQFQSKAIWASPLELPIADEGQQQARGNLRDVLMSSEPGRLRDTLAHMSALQLEPDIPEPQDKTPAGSKLATVIDKMAIPLARDDIPAVLRDRVTDAIKVAEQDSQMGLSMAASLSQRWSSPPQSEFIFSEVMALCEDLSKGRGLEMTVTMFRSFIQKISDEELRRRAQLRIGRLYYERGQFGKAAVELAVDPQMDEPTSFDTLGGLVKAMSMIRLGQSNKALSLLEWVAEKSPDTFQQARAAFLLGKLNLLYGRRQQARSWLKKVAYELPDETHSQEAKALLTRIR